MPEDVDSRVYLAHDFINPGPATEDGGLAGDDIRLTGLVGGYQGGGDIARADVLGQGLPDVLDDV